MAAATMSWDDGKHMRVKSVQLTYEDVIKSIEAVYDDDQNPKRHGTPGKKSDGVSLSPDEYITDVTGYYKTTGNEDAIAALAFRTNKTEYGPFGNKTGNQFSIQAPKDNQIAGFQGTSSNVLNSIDVHFAPIPSASTGGQPAGSAASAKKLEAKGGNAGNPWNDGAHDGVKKVYVGQGESGVTYVKFVYEKDSKEVPGNDHGKKTLLAPEEFVLDPNEYITAVEINYDNIFGTESEIITMLKFMTNMRTSPPFGLEGAKSVLLKEDGHKIVGFHGKAGADILHQVGVHVKPISK
ncbi:hypothetical protein F2Q69_00044428 [Brassica cretica]|uniref:Jacalin-type lectin domain-containing protein n=1 Tax=Brassica cretica TaxID=69181 RepID=A0A8S9NI95_BRACR|nr:hypothetical protein F2Q69_00044428 [Brassica cretica]